MVFGGWSRISTACVCSQHHQHIHCCDTSGFREAAVHEAGPGTRVAAHVMHKWPGNGQQVRGTFMLTSGSSPDAAAAALSEETRILWAVDEEKFTVGENYLVKSLSWNKSALQRNLNTQVNSEWEEAVSQQLTLSVSVSFHPPLTAQIK